MKNVFNYVVITACAVLVFSCSINVSDAKDEPVKTMASAVTTTFKVWGNCNMCKETIEGALKVPGISTADWNSETKTMTLNYDSTLISLDQIQKNIAAVGYDTEKYKGNDSAYTNLHECCQYERKQ